MHTIIYLFIYSFHLFFYPLPPKKARPLIFYFTPKTKSLLRMTDILYRYKQIAPVQTNCTRLKIIVLVQKQFAPKVKIRLQHIQVILRLTAESLNKILKDGHFNIKH